MSEAVKFTRQDFESSTWQKLKKYLNQRLADHRVALEADSPELKTAKTRGRIDEDKILLALDQAPAQGMPGD
jgi:hypothetical protein